MTEGSTTLKVLYLDDSEAQLASLRVTLSEAGYSIAVAKNVTEAQELLADRDLVIIDWHMPEMSGAEALRLLKAHRHASPKALYYLYTVDAEAAGGFKSHGFDGAFTMKGQPETLLVQIDAARRFIKMRRYMAERR
jgi:CheY-like chemotaxis protein